MDTELLRPVKLTSEQIEDVLNTIRTVPIYALTNDIKEDIRNGIVSTLKRQLVDIKLVPLPKAFEAFKQGIIKKFCTSMVQSGTPVGIEASEAISAPVTQTSLNSFHQSGSAKNVSYGISGMIEIFNISKTRKNPYTTIHYKNKNMTFEEVLDTRRELNGIMFGDLVKDFDIEEVEKFEDIPEWFNDYLDVNNMDNDFMTEGQWYLKLYLNVPMLYSYKISMQKLVEILSFKEKIITCIPSPLYKGEIYIFVQDEKIEQRPKGKKEPDIISTTSEIGRENIGFTYLNIAVLQGIKDLLVSGLRGIKNLFPQEIQVISLIDSQVKASTIQDNDIRGFIKPNLPDLENLWYVTLNFYRTYINGVNMDNIVKIFEACGIKIINRQHDLMILVHSEGKPTDIVGNKVNEAKRELSKFYKNRKIENASLYKTFKPQLPDEPDTPELIKAKDIFSKGIYIFAAVEGSNFKSLLKRSELDSTRVICNDFYDCFNTLGIEATRNLLIKEIIDVVLAEEYINYRHISLLSEFMTNRGTLLPVTPSGINRQSIPPWTKVTVEKAVDTFASASAFGNISTPNSVSTSIMFGQRALIGTGSQIEIIKADNLEDEFDKALESGEIDLKQTLGGDDVNVVTDFHEIGFRRNTDETGESVGTTQKTTTKQPLDFIVPFAIPRYEPKQPIATPRPVISDLTMKVMKDIEYRGDVKTDNTGRNKIIVKNITEKVEVLQKETIEEPSPIPKKEVKIFKKVKPLDKPIILESITKQIDLSIKDEIKESKPDIKEVETELIEPPKKGLPVRKERTKQVVNEYEFKEVVKPKRKLKLPETNVMDFFKVLNLK
jgi:hypothetical protein